MHLRRILAVAAAVVLDSAVVLAAQTPGTPTTEEVVSLSPFTVSDTDDKSWQATTTLIGSRTS